MFVGLSFLLLGECPPRAGRHDGNGYAVLPFDMQLDKLVVALADAQKEQRNFSTSAVGGRKSFFLFSTKPFDRGVTPPEQDVTNKKWLFLKQIKQLIFGTSLYSCSRLSLGASMTRKKEQQS